MVYIDTSIIVKLYIREELSPETSNWLKMNNEAIPLTRFHELEFVNAIQLKRFRSEITKNESLRITSAFKEHEIKGIFYRPRLEWSEIFNHAISLSKNYSSIVGSRSLDILHIATALSIKADNFLTADNRQSELAKRAGMKMVNIFS